MFAYMYVYVCLCVCVCVCVCERERECEFVGGTVGVPLCAQLLWCIMCMQVMLFSYFHPHVYR